MDRKELQEIADALDAYMETTHGRRTTEVTLLKDGLGYQGTDITTRGLNGIWRLRYRTTLTGDVLTRDPAKILRMKHQAMTDIFYEVLGRFPRR